jgi:hypothetical protein
VVLGRVKTADGIKIECNMTYNSDKEICFLMYSVNTGPEKRLHAIAKRYFTYCASIPCTRMTPAFGVNSIKQGLSQVGKDTFYNNGKIQLQISNYPDDDRIDFFVNPKIKKFGDCAESLQTSRRKTRY